MEICGQRVRVRVISWLAELGELDITVRHLRNSKEVVLNFDVQGIPCLES